MSSGQDYEEGYENLKTNGEGLIQSIRRRSYTTYSILSEIFGNLNGSIIYINYVKDKTIKWEQYDALSNDVIDNISIIRRQGRQ